MLVVRVGGILSQREDEPTGRENAGGRTGDKF